MTNQSLREDLEEVLRLLCGQTSMSRDQAIEHMNSILPALTGLHEKAAILDERVVVLRGSIAPLLLSSQ